MIEVKVKEGGVDVTIEAGEREKATEEAVAIFKGILNGFMFNIKKEKRSATDEEKDFAAFGLGLEFVANALEVPKTEMPSPMQILRDFTLMEDYTSTTCKFLNEISSIGGSVVHDITVLTTVFRDVADRNNISYPTLIMELVTTLYRGESEESDD